MGLCHIWGFLEAVVPACVSAPACVTSGGFLEAVVLRPVFRTTGWLAVWPGGTSRTNCFFFRFVY
jgi:hypothetical protein